MMKKISIIIISTFFIGISGITFAKGNQGCCSRHGGLAYCSNGRWVCNDGTYSPTCTCGGGYSNSYSNYYTNTYTYRKTCYESYGFGAIENYDGTCSCMAGYTRGKDIFGNTSCITLDQACKDQFGSHAKSTGNGYCGCNAGYIMKNGKCVDEASEKYSECLLISNSEFDFYTNTCSCKKGYTFDGYNCISNTQSCQNQYGINATAGDPGYCICKNGYEWNSNKTACIKSNTAYGGYPNYINTNSSEPKEIEDAKKYLGENKVKVVESLADTVMKKGGKTQKAIQALCEEFKTDKDEYTRNFGTYLGYLIK